MKQYTITISFIDPVDEDKDATDEEMIEELTEVLKEIGLEDIDISLV